MRLHTNIRDKNLLKIGLSSLAGILTSFVFMNFFIGVVVGVITFFLLSKADRVKILEDREEDSNIKNVEDFELKTIKLSKINIEEEIV